MTADTMTAPPRTVQRNTTRYMCRVKKNPMRVEFCNLGGVSFAAFKFKTFGKSEGNRPPQSVAPTCELTDAQIARVKDLIPRSVFRPFVGLVKPTRSSKDPKTGRVVDGEEVQMLEEDVPASEYLEFFPVEDDATIAQLRDDLRQKQAELDAYRAKEKRDALADNEDEAEEAGERTVGPRNKAKNKGGRPRKDKSADPRPKEAEAAAESNLPTAEPDPTYDPR